MRHTGIDDPRMPLSQSFQLHYALKQRGEIILRNLFVCYCLCDEKPLLAKMHLRVAMENETHY